MRLFFASQYRHLPFSNIIKLTRRKSSTIIHDNNTRTVTVSERRGTTSSIIVNQSHEKNASTISAFACNVQIGSHHFFSDVKAVEKGGDFGPSPKELLYAAVGSCSIMTIRTFYENSKNIKNSSWDNTELINISIVLNEIKGNHAHLPDGLDIVISLVGCISDIQKKRLLRASENCPVKKIISGGLLMNTVLR